MHLVGKVLSPIPGFDFIFSRMLLIGVCPGFLMGRLRLECSRREHVFCRASHPKTRRVHLLSLALERASWRLARHCQRGPFPALPFQGKDICSAVAASPSSALRIRHSSPRFLAQAHWCQGCRTEMILCSARHHSQGALVIKPSPHAETRKRLS